MPYAAAAAAEPLGLAILSPGVHWIQVNGSAGARLPSVALPPNRPLSTAGGRPLSAMVWSMVCWPIQLFNGTAEPSWDGPCAPAPAPAPRPPVPCPCPPPTPAVHYEG